MNSEMVWAIVKRYSQMRNGSVKRENHKFNNPISFGIPLKRGTNVKVRDF